MSKKRNYLVGRGKPPIHSQIKKGEVRNPQGGRAHKKVMLVRQFKELNREELGKVCELIMKGTIADAKKLRDDPLSPLIIRWTAKLILEGHKQDYLTTYETFLNRFVGEPIKNINHSGKIETTPNTQLPGVVLVLPEKEIHAKDIRQIASGEVPTDQAATGTTDRVPKNNS